jgi:hypothetical protein
MWEPPNQQICTAELKPTSCIPRRGTGALHLEPHLCSYVKAAFAPHASPAAARTLSAAHAAHALLYGVLHEMFRLESSFSTRSSRHPACRAAFPEQFSVRLGAFSAPF